MNKKDTVILEANNSYTGEFSTFPAVQYKPGEPWAVMDIFAPMSAERYGGKLPLVVFVQGSGWTTPNRLYATGRLLRLVEQGYVVATVNHRDSLNGRNPFPAYLEDVKSAIRYLRLNADMYFIDPERVGFWGTSSGGNTALMIAMTPDDTRYNDGTNEGVSDKIDYAVACFAPSDVYGVLNGEEDNINPDIIGCSKAVVGLQEKEQWEHATDEQRARAWDMSPTRIAEPGKDYPPILLIHGDHDELVNYEESVNLQEKLTLLGYDSQFVTVRGALHEANLWSRDVEKVIADFINEHA